MEVTKYGVHVFMQTKALRAFSNMSNKDKKYTILNHHKAKVHSFLVNIEKLGFLQQYEDKKPRSKRLCD